jgi:probable rRNA maturation factor
VGHSLEVELIGGDGLAGAPDAEEAHRLCAVALAAAGISDGHLAIEYVDEARIAALNAEHRGRQSPTDVLSFPVDESDAAHGPRELGDVVICPVQTQDLREAIVHGVLHLAGMDHEVDDGEMLALQDEIVRWETQDGLGSR